MNKRGITYLHSNHNLFKIKTKRELSKLPSIMAEMKSKKMESDVASFIDVGKLLKRTTPENLNVFFLALT